MMTETTNIVSPRGLTRFTRTESLHIIPDSEIRALVEYLNLVLLNDQEVMKELKETLPIVTGKLFDMCKDGLRLCSLFTAVMPKRFRTPREKLHSRDITRFNSMENHNLLIDACAAAGCKLVNVGEADLGSGVPHIVLGIIWRIVELGFSMRSAKIVDSKVSGELQSQLLAAGNTRDQILAWVNHCIAKHGHPKRVKNFHSDLKDCVAFSFVLTEVEPDAAAH